MRLAYVLLAGCSFQNAASSSTTTPDAAPDATVTDPVDANVPATWFGTHGRRKPITIAPGGTGGPLADFPVGIRIAADLSLASHAQPDGSDLVITTDDAQTVLASELAYYDAATGAAELWVKIPSLALTTSTTVYLYYGGPPTAGTPTQVWSNGFKGVWHLSGDATATTERDSTTNGNTLGQTTATRRPLAGAGAAPVGVTTGRARAFDGIDDTMSAPDQNALDVGTSSFAVSIWLFSVSSNGSYDPPLSKGGTSPGNPGYTIFAGTGQWTGKLMEDTGQNNFVNPFFSAAPVNGRWVHLVMSVRRSPNTTTTFVDGAQVAQANYSLTGFSGSAAFVIGGTSDHFQGSIDEVRLLGRTLDPTSVRTEYDNFMKPGFITVGAEQVRP